MDSKIWQQNYDPGVSTTLDYPQKPIHHFLEDAAANFPDRACTIFKGAVITFKEMDAITNHVAAALVDMGVKKGDRVGIFMPNSPQFVMAYYGILKAGGVVVATNPLYTAPEIEYQASDAGIENMFVMTNFYETIKKAQPKTKIKKLIVTNLKETLPPLLRVLFTLAREKKGGFRIEGGLRDGDIWFPELLAKYKGAAKPNIEISPDDVSMFQYTGGTTGVAKGAVALHRNIVANTMQIRSWMPKLITGEEVFLLAIPLFHVYGMVAGMNMAIHTCSSMVMIPNPRDLKDVLDNLSKYHATIFPGVPAMYNGINNYPDALAGKYDLSSIKACISGASPLLRETKDQFEKLTGGKLFEGYGLSEAPTATHCNPLEGVNKPGSIGMPLPDVEVKIISLDDNETELLQGEIGEIAIHGPQVMKGYHNMPTETANTLRTMRDGKVWLFTGDIARVDEDGHFYIVDRKKELIKPGGYQVWPREVEEVIMDNPKVMDVGVAGIPDPYRGETVKAWVVVKPNETLTADELKAFCK